MVVTITTSDSSTIPPERMFKAFVLDADTLFPKIPPLAIKNVEILEGDGGAGTVKLITFGEGSQYKSAKHRVDSIDMASLTFCYSIIEGDVLSDKFKKVSYEVKIEASSDGGSTCQTTAKYYTIGRQGQINSGNENPSVMFKAIEAYLLANPDA